MKRTTQKRLIILSLLCIVIAFIFFFKDYIVSLFEQKPQKLFSVSTNSVKEIALQSDTEKIILYKKNNIWFTQKKSTEFTADSGRIQSLINAISQIAKENIVSNNKNNHSQFGISKQQTLTFINNKSTHTIYIGNQTDSPNTNYIAIDSDPDVFSAEGLNTVYSPADYRDLKLGLVQDENSVTDIEESYDSIHFKLHKQNDDWYLDGKKVKKDRVDFFMNDLKTLSANDIVTDDTRYLTPSLQIIITEKGEKIQADFYQKDTEQYLVKIPGNNNIYQLQVAYIQSLKKEPTGFGE